MKITQNIFAIIFSLSFICLFTVDTTAQRGYVKSKIKKDMEKKYADSQRVKGKQELEKITYENDKRYKDPTNKVQATIVFESNEFNKNGTAKNSMVQKVIFGRYGECVVMSEGEKNETWMIYNYAEKANYMVNVKNKSAVKMPLINMQKMAEAAANHEAKNNVDGKTNSWKATGETQNINGYNCSKYIYTHSDNKSYSTTDVWMSTDLSLNLGDNYMFGARLNAYKFPENVSKSAMKGGVMVRMVMYDKKGKAVSQRDLKEFKKSADEQYFDMSKFKVTDVMGAL